MLTIYTSKLNLDEVVFENRNQLYGAYSLRKSYPNHLNKSVAVVLSSLMLLPLLGWFTKTNLPLKNVVNLTNASSSKPIQLEQLELDYSIVQPQIATASNAVTSNLNYQIATDRVVATAANIPLTNVLGNTQSTSGTQTTDVGSSQGQSNGTTIASTEVTPTIKDFAEVMPVFNNGNGTLEDFLTQQLTYPELAYQAQREGKVVVVFVVDENGVVTNPEIIKSLGFGCDEEA